MKNMTGSQVAEEDENAGTLSPVKRLHPDLLQLMQQMGIIPPEGHWDFSEAEVAEMASNAVNLAPEPVQIALIGRLMSEEEIALRLLAGPEVSDLSRTAVISSEEKRVLLRREVEGQTQVARGEKACMVCSGQARTKLSCGCWYCLICLRNCIRSGMASEADFPPRCCSPFNEASIKLGQCPGLVQLWRQLNAEFGTAMELRVYCSNAACSVFLGAERDLDQLVGWLARCGNCGVATCVHCGATAHLGLPCGEGNDEDDFLDTMDANGLVACPACGMVIALREGCNHLTLVLQAHPSIVQRAEADDIQLHQELLWCRLLLPLWWTMAYVRLSPVRKLSSARAGQAATRSSSRQS